MTKIVLAALLSAFVAATAVAAENKGNLGVNLSTDGVSGIQGELDISSRVNDAPVSAQAFFKSFSQDTGPRAVWDTTAVGVAGIYDFSAVARLDKKFHPYAGLGLISVSHHWKGTGSAVPYNGVSGGLYLVGGIRYFLTSQLDADFNYNSFGDLTAGVNFKF